MSTPNPLIPQGTFQAQAAKGASNVRLAVATIVAIHIVFFGGLLLQGCKRDPKIAESAAATDTNSASAFTNLSLAPIDSNSLYYPPGGLPGEAGTNFADTLPAMDTAGNAAETMWQSTNLSSPGTAGTLAAGGESATAMKEYTIVRGDTLGAIAQRNRTTVSALRDANPGIDPLRIRPGQKINVPMASQSSAELTLNGSSAQRSVESGAPTYTVKAGDNLTRIANKHGITVSQLRAANNLRTSRVNIGQKLKIPAQGGNATGAGGVPTNESPGQVF